MLNGFPSGDLPATPTSYQATIPPVPASFLLWLLLPPLLLFLFLIFCSPFLSSLLLLPVQLDINDVVFMKWHTLVRYSFSFASPSQAEVFQEHFSLPLRCSQNSPSLSNYPLAWALHSSQHLCVLCGASKSTYECGIPIRKNNKAALLLPLPSLKKETSFGHLSWAKVWMFTGRSYQRCFQSIELSNTTETSFTLSGKAQSLHRTRIHPALDWWAPASDCWGPASYWWGPQPADPWTVKDPKPKENHAQVPPTGVK